MGKNILGAGGSALPMSCYTWRKQKIPERKLRAQKKKVRDGLTDYTTTKKDRLKKEKKKEG